MSHPAIKRSDGRAAFFVAAAIAAFFLAIPFSMWLAATPTDLSQIERLGAEIGCVCGTCPHRPIGTCGCGFADGMLARLDAEIAAGKSDSEIMVTFVAEYGTGIKIKPDGSGLDLVAWLAPMALLAVGAVAMAGVIAQWRAHQPAPPTGGEEATPSEAPTAEPADRVRELVERELKAFDE